MWRWRRALDTKTLTLMRQSLATIVFLQGYVSNYQKSSLIIARHNINTYEMVYQIMIGVSGLSQTTNDRIRNHKLASN